MDTYACADCGREFSDGTERDDHFMSPACPCHGLEGKALRLEQRRQALIRFHQRRGWLNCSHKSLTRLWLEYGFITRSRRARIWIFENDGPVKITLQPGQTLKWAKSGPTDEGWSSQGFTLEWDGRQLVQHWFSDGTDCDGRMSRSGTLITTPDKFFVREPYIGDAREADTYAGIRWPEWEKAGRDRQRDYAAEAAGY